MTVASAAATHSKKLMKLTLSLFRRRFNSSKCKTAAKMAVARIKLLRNRRQVVVKQMRRDIALLLQSGEDATARIRVEHVIREQNVLAANEFIELFCELVVARLSIIAKRRECPADLKEGIASLIFAAPRCAEIPELINMRNIFEKKYGRDFVSAATDLRPSCGVNRLLIEKLSVKTPSGELKLKVMKEIAKEHQIEWNAAESEKELLKPPEELIEGPNKFVSASTIPVKPVIDHPLKPKEPVARSMNNGGGGHLTHFEDTVSAASAATELAREAMAAAQAATYLANKNGSHSTDSSGAYSSQFFPQHMDHQPRPPRSQSYGTSFDPDEEMKLNKIEGGKVYRRHSYNIPRVHSDIKWDDSDCGEDIEVEDDAGSIKPPPQRPAPPVPSSKVNQDGSHRVHPKLPDYEDLAARFEALKYHKSQK